MRNRKFTLLEVIVAMVLLAIFVSGLLWQFSMAVNRSAENYRRWEYMHELSQATEQLLLIGPEGELDQSFLNPDYRIDGLEKWPDFRQLKWPNFPYSAQKAISPHCGADNGRRKLRAFSFSLSGIVLHRWKTANRSERVKNLVKLAAPIPHH